MNYRYFTVLATGGEFASLELNQFINQHRVLGVEQHFVADGQNSYWAVCVRTLPAGGSVPQAAAGESKRKGGVDYRELLPPEDFARYAALRSLRNDLAKRDGVPAYAVVTNEHLANMAQMVNPSLSAIEKIDGIGPKRIERYGTAFLEVLLAESDDGHDKN